ncbi:hypothetical protein HYPSUDRAFT_46945 [Hypholoma sublateritium FD-334 SS-4]|uniref:Uncharacterized protein n=1 Tax=Hypholoma sublateritium (strain FD-334 SS-4) TaxID=945553 RepID=A0A0D2NCT7_HYPSF|nr:hypothetical protein HYPSUDRAFT_46945 [Hypholoma sublateritium FD-334 SS-4]
MGRLARGASRDRILIARCVAKHAARPGRGTIRQQRACSSHNKAPQNKRTRRRYSPAATRPRRALRSVQTLHSSVLRTSSYVHCQSAYQGDSPEDPPPPPSTPSRPI